MADTTDGFDYNSVYDDGVDDDGVWDYNDGPNDEERAHEILTELEKNPSLMREFNLLLRQKKIEQIKKK